MITDTGFACTDEELDNDDADYTAFGDDLQEDARALLATVRHLLSGPEIAAVEAAADMTNSDGVDIDVMVRLQNQFSREIGEWKDGVRK